MNLNKLLKLMEKNFRLVWKSRLFVLLILLGPLLLTIFLGLAFNNSKDYAIRAGVFSENYDGVKEDILKNLKNDFLVIKFDSLKDCVNSVKSFETHICAALPLEIDLEGDELSEVVFYVDNSRTNLVWLVLDSLSNFFSLSSQQLSTGMASNLLSRLNIAERKSVELQKYVGEAVEQGETSLISVGELAEEIALLNLADTKNKIQESLDLHDSLSQSMDKTLETIDQSQALLNSIKAVLGNSSSIGLEIDDLSDRLNEIENLVGNGKLDDLENSLDEVRAGFGELEKKIEISVRKNNEILILLEKLKKNLLAINSLVDELNIAVSNLKVTRADKIVEPIRTRIEPISVEKTYLGFIFPTLVMLIVAFVSVLLSSSLVVMEKKNRAFFRNWLSRGWGLSFILSYFLTNLTIVLVDIFVFILIIRFVFDIFINLGFLLLLVLVSGLFVLMGLVIGFIAKNEQSNVLIGVVASSVLVFFSNTLIPIESASGFLLKVIKYNPFMVGERLLRKVLMSGVGFLGWQHDFFMILVYFMIFVIILILLSMIMYEKKFEFENLFKKKSWKKWKR